MDNKELLTDLLNLQLAIDAVDAKLVEQHNEEHLPPNMRRVDRMHRNLREASAKLITTMNLAQQWIYYTGGLQPPSEAQLRPKHSFARSTASPEFRLRTT